MIGADFESDPSRMFYANRPNESSEQTQVTREDAARLLELSLETAESPRDQLLSCLAEASSEGVFFELLVRGLGAGDTPAEAERFDALEPLDRFAPFELFVRGGATLAELDAIKTEATTRLRRPSALVEDRLAATLLYFVAIAAARVRYEAIITRQPRGEIAATLDEIAVLAPEAWQTLFFDAAERFAE